MNQKERESGGKFGFLDSVTRLFRKEEEEARAPEVAPASRFASLQADFEAAIRGLNEKVEARLAESASTGSVARSRRDKTEERVAEKLRRMEASHRAIREDVEKMHARLRTGLGSADLDTVSTYLGELDAVARPGKDSHEMLPRARYAITQRLQTEAGELAVTRLLDLVRSEKLSWPDPTQRGPTVTAEEAERSRRRRLAEIRESFLAAGLKRTAERMLGIVSAWGSDYPERGSPLWEESVLEAVAAGIRGELVREFVELLRRDRELIVTRTEGSIGAELAGLQRVLQGGVTSIDQANKAVASALRVLDEAVPEIAWEHVQAQLPSAKGEWAS